MSISRREFMVGCSAAIAAMAGGRLSNLVFANTATAAGTAQGTDEILVMVFLRGGCDALSLVAPFSDATYKSKRGDGLRLYEPGSFTIGSPEQAKEALEINPQNGSYSGSAKFGFHGQTGGLHELYTGGKLAVVHACGLNDDTRSHFDAMDYIERGTPGNKGTSSGWLARHLQAISPDGLIPTVAAGSAAPASLLTDNNAVALTSIDSYNLSGVWRYTANTGSGGIYKDAMLNTLEEFYGDTSLIGSTGKRTIETIRTLRAKTPPTSSVTYPGGSFGDSLKMLAQMIKLDMGLRVATVDLGGWDHHENQGVHENYGPFYNQARTLSQGLSAFYNEIAATTYASKVTIAVMSEFGRRLGKNVSGGTDHGHGGAMLLLGNNVNGGKMYGTWPGLQDLDQNQDLRITTDFRTVLGEVLVNRLGNGNLGTVFPGITEAIYKPGGATLGVTKARPDAPKVDYTSALFQSYLP
ncbi:MAG: DUF1501 domain-containing protein, partial [Chloroflexales bacterium]|nr:DUF1501 domain-containing protein [Chloroflexales bacterium]